MTAQEYRDALDRLHLSQSGAARLLGVTGRTSRNWISGDSAVPRPVAILLRLMLAGRIKVEDVEAA